MGGRRSDETGEPELTVRQAALIAGVMSGKSQAQAARDAGYPVASAKEAAYATLARPHIQSLSRAILAELGLDPAGIGRRVLDIVDNAEVFQIDRFGARHVGPDYKTRLAALDACYRIWGSYAPVRAELDVSGNIQIVRVRDEDELGNAPRIIDVTPASDPK